MPFQPDKPNTQSSGFVPDQQQEPQQSKIGKAFDFATNLPTSAIDLIPGAKEKRQAIEQQRTATASQPSDIPGITKGQRLSDIRSSADDTAGSLGLVGEAPIWGAAKVVPGLEKLFAGSVRRSKLAPIVKDVKQLEPYVAEQVQKAREGFNQLQVAPKMLEQKAMLEGSEITLDPEKLKGINPDLDKWLASKAVVPGQLLKVPAEEGLQVRSMLNDSAGWKMHPLDPSKARAVDEAAGAAHKTLADMMTGINPSIGELSQEMQGAYGLEKSALGNAKRPINTLTNKGLTQRSRLAEFDEAAQSNLSQLGQDINTINERIQNPLLTINAAKHPLATTAANAGRIGDAVGATIGQGLATPLSEQMTGLAKLSALLKHKISKSSED